MDRVGEDKERRGERERRIDVEGESLKGLRRANSDRRRNGHVGAGALSEEREE